jgi:glutamine synthetase
VENRETALRLVPGDPTDPDDGHAELKCFDAAANPYLVVGAVLAAGLAGVDAGLEGGYALPEPVRGDPAARGDQERLPASLTEAAAHFERDDVLREAFGEVLHGAVLAVRRAEAKRFADSTPEEIADATRWSY